MKEIWKPVCHNEYVGLYEVSNLGRVKSIRRKMIMTPIPNNIGALQIILIKNGKQKHMLLNRLVWFSMMEQNDDPNMYICKKKYNIKNPYKMSNLEAISKLEFFKEGGPHARHQP